ncbi:Sodium/calcium exchanger protein [Trichomonas vaginalis G3]|uniref:Sodium/calcium exchanger protein n=1 Tax=Trichomonas vaginalis (strain ATCC PRA-98 / G3) TaxID=412133 RepID=A2DCI5_TRIV3|nr:cation/H+ exchanger protein 1-related family [Trichomonas vaginalis G3]EAY21922.1 Sodium/calcium exchanger protein [Trichomonas vaginalis G3]KAI5487603.1 cation/H+ exchanger protein 1-related family [Trichomonas vaginalis G3]|eukprot:XP_001582908.1 Sodium/calcium exchanger protein [Trichomonas vaginalis G3]
MSTQPLIDNVQMKTYTQEKDAESEDVSSVHIDVDDMPHVMGLRPAPPRQELNLPTIEALESFKKHRMCSVSNIIWSIFIGWWVAIAFVVVGILFFLTGFFYRHGIFCFRAAYFIVFPFGKIAHTKTTSRCHFLARGLWCLFLPIYGIISLLGAVISWEFVYYIPMAKTLWKLVTVCLKENPENIEFTYATDKKASIPLILCSQSGSWYYFKFTVYGFEVIYLNFIPFVFLSLLVGFVNFGHTGLGDPILGSVFALFGAMPAAYFIGVCVDDLSKTLGIIIGSILCSVFLALIELILYYFSLKTGMVDITRAAITGAFLMNLLIIPGVAMLAAGIKWKETVLNRKAQSIGGYFLLLAIISMLFPSVFYHIHGGSSYKCDQCTLNGTAPNQTFNCDYCTNKEIKNIVDDPVYKKFGAPLQYTMSILMPAIYIISFMFSVRTHAHIYVVEHDGEHEKGMSTVVAIVILCIATVTFSLMAHVMTDKMPEALEKLHLSERFVGLIFYTLIPNAAEYINAIKFALNGNIGLSMEIGNQGAILTSLVEMPALMLISLILYKTKQTKVMFTLIFPLIDIFSIVTAVFLRNAILMEKKINYSTGLSFLIIFTLISVVYYFENF